MAKDRKSSTGTRSRVSPITVQKYLGGVDYPARKQDLVQRAKDKGADDDVMSALNALEDRQYDSPVEVTRAISNKS